MTVGIDGDVLRYELGAVAMEKEEVFGITVERPWPSSDVYELVDQRIQSIIERSGESEFEIYVTGPGNFRFDIATIRPYKGNRSAVQKPYHWGTVSDRLLLHWGARVVEGIEADDALALAATEATRAGLRYVIASRDKDLRQVPCLHYSWACGESQPEKPVYGVEGLGEIELVTVQHPKSKSHKVVGNGIRFFYSQMLTGDTVDNIQGCPRVGPVEAVKLLQNLETEQEMFLTVAWQYRLKYGDGWKAALEENARLLWLIQSPDWVSVEEADGVIKYKVNQYWEVPTDDLGEYESRGSLQ